MSKLVRRVIAFSPSDSPDVASYKLYYAPGEDSPGVDHVMVYEDPNVNLGIPPLADVGGEQKHTVDLSTIPALAGIEGSTDLAVTAVDGVGNESDFAEAEDVQLDLTPPNPPSGVVVVSNPS